MAPVLEHTGPAVFVEKITEAIGIENESANGFTSDLLVRMGTRANQLLGTEVSALGVTIVRIFESTGVHADLQMINGWKRDLTGPDAAASFGSASAYRIDLVGAMDELRCTVDLRGMLQLQRMYGGRLAEDNVASADNKIRKLKRKVGLLKKHTSNHGDPTEVERQEWRRQHRYRIRSELAEKKSLLVVLSGSFQRGQNNRHYVYNYERTAAMKRATGVQKRIVDLESQLAISQQHDPQDEGALFQQQVPDLLKVQAVDSLETALRCAEEIVFQLPAERLAFYSAAKRQAAKYSEFSGLLFAEAQDQARSSKDKAARFGESTFLLELAQSREEWAVRAAAAYLPSLPLMPVSHARAVFDEAWAVLSRCQHQQSQHHHHHQPPPPTAAPQLVTPTPTWAWGGAEGSSWF